jgi:hypothetical protein
MRDHRVNRSPLFVRGMQGLGDNIMQRPFIRAAAQREPVVYLQTPWPELYADLENVRPVRSQTRLRTQAKNESRWRGRWWPRPSLCRAARVNYGGVGVVQGVSIMESMEASLPLGDQPFVWDLPDLGPPFEIDTGGRPIAIVRPVTERAEWLNQSRSPRPEYVNAAAERLAGSHFVIAVADLQPGQEWLVGPMPVCDVAYIRGELPAMDLLALMAQADVVIGGVGWIVPAALALGTRAFIYLGGNGAHNGPEQLVYPKADSSRLGLAVPRNFCRCAEKQHRCDKVIDGPLEQFETWARGQGVKLCSRTSSAAKAA